MCASAESGLGFDKIVNFKLIFNIYDQIIYYYISANFREQQIDTHARCVRSLDESVKELYERVTDNQKRLVGRK